MKKFFLLIVLVLSVLPICAQGLYRSIRYYDKFDDEIKFEQIKTLIDVSDSTIVFETKGRAPQTYYVVGKRLNGNKDDIKNLVSDVYGYEVEYACVSTEELKNEHRKYAVSNETADKFIEEHQKEIIVFMFRTVTTQFSGSYISKLAWILKNDRSRIIFEE